MADPAHDDLTWLDRALYPFALHDFPTADGRLRYAERGEGPPVLCVHGTPTWSFLYRRLLSELAGGWRVIAPDHLGFGTSDKPESAPYRPADHARRLSALIDGLGLDRVVLVVHDFGGPIGLSWALDHPDRVSGLVLFNTWMWSLESDRRVVRASRILGGPLGRLLYRHLNLSPRVLLPAAVPDRGKIPDRVWRHYRAPFPDPASREAPWVLARELLGSSDLYQELWDRRERLRDIPTLLLWGLRDPAFGPDALERWKRLFTRARVRAFPDAGHLVPEEEPEATIQSLRAFFRELPGSDPAGRDRAPPDITRS